jgi:hypothetical protein
MCNVELAMGNVPLYFPNGMTAANWLTRMKFFSDRTANELTLKLQRLIYLGHASF